MRIRIHVYTREHTQTYDLIKLETPSRGGFGFRSKKW